MLKILLQEGQLLSVKFWGKYVIDIPCNTSVSKATFPPGTMKDDVGIML